MDDKTVQELFELDNSTSKSHFVTSLDNEWFITEGETDVESFLEEIKSNNFGEQLKRFHPILAVITILLALFAGYLFILLLLWERNGMDPMKRGIINRVSPRKSIFCKGLLGNLPKIISGDVKLCRILHHSFGYGGHLRNLCANQ